MPSHKQKQIAMRKAKSKAQGITKGNPQTQSDKIFTGFGYKDKPKQRKFKARNTNDKLLDSGEKIHLDSYKNQRYKRLRERSKFTLDSGTGAILEQCKYFNKNTSK